MRSRISIIGYVRPSVRPSHTSWKHAKVPFLTKITITTSENASYAVYPALFFLSSDHQTLPLHDPWLPTGIIAYGTPLILWYLEWLVRFYIRSLPMVLIKIVIIPMLCLLYQIPFLIGWFFILLWCWIGFFSASHNWRSTKSALKSKVSERAFHGKKYRYALNYKLSSNEVITFAQYNTAENRGVSLGPLACSFDHCLAPLTRSLARHCTFRSHAPQRSITPQWVQWLWNRRVEYWISRSYARSFTNSLRSSWESDLCLRTECVNSIQLQPTVHSLLS